MNLRQGTSLSESRLITSSHSVLVKGLVPGTSTEDVPSLLWNELANWAVSCASRALLLLFFSSKKLFEETFNTHRLCSEGALSMCQHRVSETHGLKAIAKRSHSRQYKQQPRDAGLQPHPPLCAVVVSTRALMAEFVGPVRHSKKSEDQRC